MFFVQDRLKKMTTCLIKNQQLKLAGRGQAAEQYTVEALGHLSHDASIKVDYSFERCGKHPSFGNS